VQILNFTLIVFNVLEWSKLERLSQVQLKALFYGFHEHSEFISGDLIDASN
jgi:hypothetical protein